MSERGSCRTCGKAILWVETQSGKRMPLDYPGERRFVLESGEGMLARQRETYVSHFATCKQADHWRKPKEG